MFRQHIFGTGYLGRLLFIALGVLFLSACGQEDAGTTAQDGMAAQNVVRGAGATFPEPLYRAWLDRFKSVEPDLAFSYEAVGSGEGIKRFIAEEVDFGASDAAMSDAEIAKVSRGAVLVPATAGMVVLAYNVDGIGSGLKLSRDVLVDIFLSKIDRWNDPRIADANPGVALPAKLIQPVVRRDSSGTTFAFSSHLSAISAAWQNGPGTGKQIDWPGGVLTGAGNEGVAQKVKVSQGAIGYMEYGFAKRLGLPMAAVENKAGQFVGPDDASGSSAIAAAADRDLPSNLRLFIPDPPGRESYPMVSLTWLLLYGTYRDHDTATALKALLSWGLSDGQSMATELGYIQLPKNIVAKATDALQSIN